MWNGFSRSKWGIKGQVKKLLDMFKTAKKLGLENVYACSLVVELGDRAYFSKGSEKNIKLTTVEDIEIFKALLNSEKNNGYKAEQEAITVLLSSPLVPIEA